MNFKLTLQETRTGMAIAETHPRYLVLVNGEKRGELYFNMTGYTGYLPTHTGALLDVGEGGISRFKRAVAQINADAKAAAVRMAQRAAFHASQVAPLPANVIPMTPADEAHLFGTAPVQGSGPVTDDELQDFRVALEDKIRAEHRQLYPSLPLPDISFMRGPRYTRIVKSEGAHSRSAYGFIDMQNGDLLKSAGWKAPAKHARGNLRGADPLQGCNRHGMAYLR